MIRPTLLYLFFVSFALSSYLPMSQKKHNFGDNVCRYYDFGEQIDYVKPCETNKYCHETETNLLASTMNKIHTCQKYMEIPPNPTTYTPKKDRYQPCEENGDCIYSLFCLTGTDSTKKCDLDCGEGSGKTVYKIDDHYECRYVDNKCYYTKDNILNHYQTRSCKVCGQITYTSKNAGDKTYRVMTEADENNKFSQADGTFVIEEEACSSHTALLFYLDGKIKNEIDSTYTHYSENKMYPRCVSIKAVDYENERFNYTIGTDDVYIYDINEVQFDDVDNQGNSLKKNALKNILNRYLMTQIELWNNNKQEYINYYDTCQVSNIDDAMRRKIYYLEHPEEYLLYKDQTEVIEYLIQKEYPYIVPIIQSSKEDSAGFLSSTYIILSLMLLFL